MSSIEDVFEQLILKHIINELVYQKLSDCVQHKLQGYSDEIIKQEIQNFVDKYRFLFF